jgi:hypothetical protein
LIDPETRRDVPAWLQSNTELARRYRLEQAVERIYMPRQATAKVPAGALTELYTPPPRSATCLLDARKPCTSLRLAVTLYIVGRASGTQNKSTVLKAELQYVRDFEE